MSLMGLCVQQSEKKRPTNKKSLWCYWNNYWWSFTHGLKCFMIFFCTSSSTRIKSHQGIKKSFKIEECNDNSTESNKTHSYGHVEECGGKISIWKIKVTQHYSQCVKISYKLYKHTSTSSFTEKKNFWSCNINSHSILIFQ
jgi:hypothetical protein